MLRQEPSANVNDQQGDCVKDARFTDLDLFLKASGLEQKHTYNASDQGT